ncbi:hypothetical protein Tsp_08380 [Trichinella spiralis]|uniref:hypothetical protein n=1 Tax=Trichinella spiralis TaxID=6334 RepID=UPI0001EFB36F|nr:hypothetical protein Tsp_08380 [Trichinella spiralis]
MTDSKQLCQIFTNGSKGVSSSVVASSVKYPLLSVVVLFNSFGRDSESIAKNTTKFTYYLQTTNFICIADVYRKFSPSDWSQGLKRRIRFLAVEKFSHQSWFRFKGPVPFPLHEKNHSLSYETKPTTAYPENLNPPESDIPKQQEKFE